MHLNYELTVDDLVSMTVYNIKTAPVWQQQQRRGRVVIGLITMLLCLSTISLIPHASTTLFNIGLAIIGGAVLFALHPKLVEPTLKKRAAQFFQSDRGSGNVGAYTLTLVEGNMTQLHRTSVSQYEWKDVERLDVTGQYLYIFAGKSNCITLPKKLLSVQDIEAIIDIMHVHHVVVNQVA